MEKSELNSLELSCIEEEAPWCQAACPLHVDARQLCRHLAAGEMAQAWGALLKQMPLPGVLGRICDHPCQQACRRGQAGDPLNISALERALVQTPEPSQRRLPLPARPGRVAVAGAGLGGLTAAWDLARKGWSVTVLTGLARLEDALLGLGLPQLPPSAVAGELARLAGERVAFQSGQDLGPGCAARLLSEFDAVYLGFDDPSLGEPASSLDLDPATGAAGREGLFAGGLGEVVSLVGLAAQARRAALSLDRHLQKVSLSAGRQGEGPQTTRLFTSLKGVEPLPAVAMADPAQGYSPEEARQEAARCLQCRCLECVKVCKYLEEFKAYPRSYARQVYNNEAIVKGQHAANLLVNSCMLCKLCTAVCPEGFAMAEMILGARQRMVAEGRMPPSAHEFALQDMDYSNGPDCALSRHQPGTSSSASLFFPGCQLGGSLPDHVQALYQHLCASLPGGVGLMLGCCGAPARWAGREDRFGEVMAQLEAGWRDMGRPRIIAACPTCLGMLRGGLEAAQVESVWEALAQGQPPAGAGLPLPGTAGELALHDPCAARDDQALRDGVRHLLARLGGNPAELPLSGGLTQCCGFGGLAANANPALARKVVQERASQSGQDYVTYCAMCRDRLARAGKRTLHVLDLLFPAQAGPDPAARPDPGFSARRENRARLKAGLLAGLWGEPPAPPVAQAGPELVVSAQLAELLEERRILLEDLRQVVAQAEATGRKFINPVSGRFLARWRGANVTFWVEYALEEGRAVAHNAYSHRMQVLEKRP